MPCCSQPCNQQQLVLVNSINKTIHHDSITNSTTNTVTADSMKSAQLQEALEHGGWPGQEGENNILSVYIYLFILVLLTLSLEPNILVYKSATPSLECSPAFL